MLVVSPFVLAMFHSCSEMLRNVIASTKRDKFNVQKRERMFNLYVCISRAVYAGNDEKCRNAMEDRTFVDAFAKMKFVEREPENLSI